MKKKTELSVPLPHKLHFGSKQNDDFFPSPLFYPLSGESIPLFYVLWSYKTETVISFQMS